MTSSTAPRRSNSASRWAQPVPRRTDENLKHVHRKIDRNLKSGGPLVDNTPVHDPDSRQPRLPGAPSLMARLGRLAATDTTVPHPPRHRSPTGTTSWPGPTRNASRSSGRTSPRGSCATSRREAAPTRSACCSTSPSSARSSTRRRSATTCRSSSTRRSAADWTRRSRAAGSPARNVSKVAILPRHGSKATLLRVSGRAVRGHEVVPALVPEVNVALVVHLRPETLLGQELDVQVPDLVPTHR